MEEENENTSFVIELVMIIMAVLLLLLLRNQIGNFINWLFRSIQNIIQ